MKAYTVIGVKELDEALRQLPKQLTHRIIGSANADAAKPLIQAARSNIRSRTGNLAGSIGAIKVPVRKVRQDDLGLVIVGPRFGGGYKGRHGYVVEKGHKIGPGPRMNYRFRDGRPNIRPRKRVPPYPYMVPAFHSTKTIVEGRIKYSLVSKMDQIIRRYIKKMGGTPV
jgi:hypothetical protein